jgi:hypothetical protein
MKRFYQVGLHRVRITCLALLLCSPFLWVEQGHGLSYEDYAEVLSKVVDEAGLVNYRDLRSDREKLDSFTAQLARLNRTVYEGWSEADRIAFWINAYNALTLKAVVDHYPVKSIKEIGSIFKSVWDKLEFIVMGQEVTLNDIEHRVLRMRFKEPRIHMAINCASIGCPPLRSTPFTGEDLSGQLDAQTAAFLANPDRFRLDKAGKTLYLSPIFKWFGEDFVGVYGRDQARPGLDKEETAVIAFVSKYLDAEERDLLNVSDIRIKYLDYDWGLNEQ